MEEKSFMEQPVRSQDGTIDLDDYTTFLTPRLIIKYNMMGIDDYRNLMTFLKSKNAFKVTCYDIVADRRVTHEMYFAPPSMPIIYNRYLAALGIQEYSIELIGTNRKVTDQKINFYIGDTAYETNYGDDWMTFCLNNDTGYRVEYSPMLKQFIVVTKGKDIDRRVIAVYNQSNETYVSPYKVIADGDEYIIKVVKSQ